jgi:hypothetical protein
LAIAACACDTSARARAIASPAYWSASASLARLTACCAAASSLVGGGRLAHAASARLQASDRNVRSVLAPGICAKLRFIGVPCGEGATRGHFHQLVRRLQ